MTGGEGLFVFPLKTKSVMPFFPRFFKLNQALWYYEYIKITILGTHYKSLKVYVYTRVRDWPNFYPNDIRTDGCVYTRTVSLYRVIHLVTVSCDTFGHCIV